MTDACSSGKNGAAPVKQQGELLLGCPARLKSVGAGLSAGCGEVGVALVTRVCKSPRSLPGSSVGRCVAVLSEQSDNKPIVCS